MFNKEGSLREPNKAQFADAFAKLLPKEANNKKPEKVDFSVLDGGSLLQRSPRDEGTTFVGYFGHVCNLCLEKFQKTQWLYLMEILNDLPPKMQHIKDNRKGKLFPAFTSQKIHP